MFVLKLSSSAVQMFIDANQSSQMFRAYICRNRFRCSWYAGTDADVLGMQKQMRLTDKFIFRDAQLKLLRTEGGQARNQRDGWMGEVGLSGSNCTAGIPPTTHRWVGQGRLLSGRMLSHLFCSFLVTQKICTEP